MKKLLNLLVSHMPLGMLWMTMNRTDPEVGLAIFKNAEASTAWVDGDLIMLLTGTPTINGVVVSGDGKSALLSTANALLGTVVGVCSGRDVAVGDYGTVQCYGYHGNVKATGAISAGSGLASSATARTVAASSGATDLPLTHIGFAVQDAAGGRVKAWLRCM